MKGANVFFLTAVLLAIGLVSCTSSDQYAAEEVDINEVMPKGFVTEVTNAYPEFKAQLVSSSETGIAFGEKFLEVDGIEDSEVQTRIANYVLSYLENPYKKADEVREREEYEALPPLEKMERRVERIRERYPDFSYEWVGADEGNVPVVYGDNGLMMNGIDNEGAREEWAHGIMNIQKLIDAESTGEQE